MQPDAAPPPRRIAMAARPAHVRPLDSGKLRATCSACSLRELCLPAGLGPLEINTVDKLINRRRSLARGEYLFRNDTPLQSLYAIRAGFLKTSVMHADGGEQVAGFHMPGDLLGLDAMGSNHHVCDATALGRGEVCEIPLDTLELLAHKLPALQQHFHRILSRELVHHHHRMLLLGSMRACARIAAFLLDLSRRYAARGYLPAEFLLHMTRAEIGSYLGLTLETVSRGLSHMQDSKLIQVNNRRIRIADLAGLHALAHPRADVA